MTRWQIMVVLGLVAVLGVACSSRSVEITGPAAGATVQQEQTEAVDDAAGKVEDEPAGEPSGSASEEGEQLAASEPSASSVDEDVGQQEQQEPEQAVGASPAADSLTWTVELPSHEYEAGPDVYNVSVLRGDPELDDGCVWLEGPGGELFPVRWPAGTTARFTPIAGGEVLIELIRADGTVVATGGDRIGWSGYGEHQNPGRLDRCHVGAEDNFVNVITFDLHKDG